MRTKVAHGLVAAAAVFAAAVSPLIAVTGGSPDGINHPAVGFVFAQTSSSPVCEANLYGCQGVLVAADVVLTSGWCADVFANLSEYGGTPTALWVDFNPGDGLDCTSAIRVKEAHAHPNFDETAAEPIDDVGVLILETPSSIVPATLPGLNENDSLARRDSLIVVGYGWSLGVPTLPLIRRAGVAGVVSVQDQAVISRFVTKTGTCTGGFEGQGTFVGATNEIVGIEAASTGPCRATRTQRVDIQSVRDFLDDFVTLP